MEKSYAISVKERYNGLPSVLISNENKKKSVSFTQVSLFHFFRKKMPDAGLPGSFYVRCDVLKKFQHGKSPKSSKKFEKTQNFLHGRLKTQKTSTDARTALCTSQHSTSRHTLYFAMLMHINSITLLVTHISISLITIIEKRIPFATTIPE